MAGKGGKKAAADGKDAKTVSKKKVKKSASAHDAKIEKVMEVLADRGPRPVPKLTMQQKLQFDFIRSMTYNNVWYYRDRLSTPRGPCTMPVLRECWVQGVIDESTLIWGQGLMDWLPIRNVRTLVPQIRTFEVQVATFIKKHLALKPALAAIRRQRSEERKEVHTTQVDRMY